MDASVENSSENLLVNIEVHVTPRQKEAILFDHDPNKVNVIIAGPGCGKTQVLANRVAHLVSCGIDPSQILVLSLTNMAVNNIRSKLKDVFNSSLDDNDHGNISSRRASVAENQIWELVHVHTFHAFAHKVVTEHCPGKVLRIIDDLSWTTVAKLVSHKDVNRYNVGKLLDMDFTNGNDDILPNSKVSRIVDQLTRYGLVSFKEMLRSCVSILLENPEIIDNSYKVIVIDEIQDIVQDLLPFIKLLFNSQCHLTIAGDPNQSIYGFLGSQKVFRITEGLLLNVESRKEVYEIQLTDCFRSSSELIDFTNQFSPLPLSSIRDSNLETLYEVLKPVLKAPSEMAQTYDYICQEILRILYKSANTIQPNDIVILAAYNRTIYDFRSVASYYGIPTKRASQMPNWMESNVGFLLYFLKIIYNPGDNDFALISCLLLINGIRQTSVDKIMEASAAKEQSIWEYLILQKKLSSKKLQNFVSLTEQRLELYNSSTSDLQKINDPKFIFNDLLQFITDADCFQKLFAIRDLTEEKIEQLKADLDEFYWAFLQQASKTKPNEMSLLEWIESGYNIDKPLEVDHHRTNTNEENGRVFESQAVNISTIHSAKGMEFPVVFIIADNTQITDIISHTLAHNTDTEQNNLPIDDDNETYEEKKRLFYVASTRARMFLYICPTQRSWFLSKPENSKTLENINSGNINPTVTTKEPLLNLQNVTEIASYLKRPAPLHSLFIKQSEKYKKIAQEFGFQQRLYSTYRTSAYRLQPSTHKGCTINYTLLFRRVVKR